MAKTVSRVGAVRKQRQIPVAELARSVGVSRQTIYAIEDGSYVPNTSVALRLGRVLGVAVEELFSLEEPGEGQLQADLLDCGGEGLKPGQTVRLCRVNDRLMAVPGLAVPSYLPQADAVVEKCGSEAATVVGAPAVPGNRFLLAGCDPALSLIGEASKASGIEIVSVPAASQRALEWLHEGKIHAAGSHLLDAESGTYNVPIVQRIFAAGSVRVITFASWRQGLLVKSGNPKMLAGIADLTRRGVLFVNRELGSGSRKMLDAGLAAAGIDGGSVRGYESCASGHLEVARRIAAGEADTGIATESAARCFGLDFLPLAVERFDLSLREGSLALPAAQVLLNVLASGGFRKKLRLIAGYDTEETGKVQL